MTSLFTEHLTWVDTSLLGMLSYIHRETGTEGYQTVMVRFRLLFFSCISGRRSIVERKDGQGSVEGESFSRESGRSFVLVNERYSNLSKLTFFSNRTLVQNPKHSTIPSFSSW
jgi:hypothetical protein